MMPGEPAGCSMGSGDMSSARAPADGETCTSAQASRFDGMCGCCLEVSGFTDTGFNGQYCPFGQVNGAIHYAKFDAEVASRHLFYALGIGPAATRGTWDFYIGKCGVCCALAAQICDCHGMAILPHVVLAAAGAHGGLADGGMGG